MHASFARNNDKLDALVRLWFRTVQYVEEDIKGRSALVRQYLAERGSTKNTPEEYEIVVQEVDRGLRGNSVAIASSVSGKPSAQLPQCRR